ncbi:PREDICTED: transcription elongation factor B polypeptide 2 [Colobus angolensis palliatus]|uniref:transcription elongation factor B polypeptide 2 n=1 Tax=Colobus angolensis palliatus TaxID=336983 RepID=UPI0005F4E1D4|nr:PREDICTED: transcription elongation factor B polypeptide 2 [Colobus angolensis palliatus]
MRSLPKMAATTIPRQGGPRLAVSEPGARRTAPTRRPRLYHSREGATASDGYPRGERVPGAGHGADADAVCDVNSGGRRRLRAPELRAGTSVVRVKRELRSLRGSPVQGRCLDLVPDPGRRGHRGIQPLQRYCPRRAVDEIEDDQLLDDGKTLGECGFTSQTARPQAPATVGLAFRADDTFEALCIEPFSSPPELPDVMKPQDSGSSANEQAVQ